MIADTAPALLCTAFTTATYCLYFHIKPWTSGVVRRV